MNEQNNVTKHIDVILASDELQQARKHERPGVIAEMTRRQLGIVPIDIDIADMDVETRRNVLMVMRGVRDELVVQREAGRDGAITPSLFDDYTV